MKKIFKRKICNNDAITDIIGTMLLLFIAIALFSVLYFFALSFDANDPAPSTNIIAHVIGDDIYFEHWGGAALELSETSIVIDIQGISTPDYVASDPEFTLSNENNEGSSDYWELGEVLVYNNPGISNNYVHIDVVDALSNSLILSGVIQIGNQAPNNPVAVSPVNGATDVDIDADLQWICNDPDGDDVVYDVYFGTTNPPPNVETDYSSENYEQGTMTVTTTYYWQIIARDTDGLETTGAIWSFTTGLEGVKTSVESLPSQISSSTYAITAINETSLELDNATLWYRWSDDGISWDGGIYETNDSVDSSASDVDSSADVGIETNFANSQDTSPDSDYMNIEEINTGSSAINEYLFVDSASIPANTEWETESGAQPWVDADDSSYIYEDKTASMEFGWLDFDDTSNTGTGFTVQFEFLCYGADGDDGFNIYYDNGGGSTLLQDFDVPVNGGAYQWTAASSTLTGQTASQINSMQIMLETTMTGQGDEIWVDAVRMHITKSASPDNYNIDFEYQWTNAEYDKSNEEVCIYVESHSGSENLNVNYWHGAAWTSLGVIDDTATPLPSWFNFTATGLSSSTYTIQLKGESEIGDSNQDDWDIDVIMLHTWDAAGGPHGIDWTIWSSPSNPDETYSSGVWSWNFNFPNGDGFYEFYSQGKKMGETSESQPVGDVADANCEKT